MTFADLEADPYELRGDPSALELWYHAVRERDISLLSNLDLARSCRQQLWLDHVVPVMVDRLHQEPLAGDLYDGELLVALREVPEAFWQSHTSLVHVIAEILYRPIDFDDDTVRDDANSFLERIKPLL